MLQHQLQHERTERAEMALKLQNIEQTRTVLNQTVELLQMQMAVEASERQGLTQQLQAVRPQVPTHSHCIV